LTNTDTTVVTDELYYYYVIALDTSFLTTVSPPTRSRKPLKPKLVAVTALK
jgi:hypothetical protein